MELSALIVRLRDLITSAYLDTEFAELMFVKVGEFDYAGLPGSSAYGVKVLEVVKWTHRVGGSARILWLAELVSADRPGRAADFNPLLADLRTLAAPAAAGPVQ